MTEIVAKTGVKKESGYLYFLNKDCDITRVKMARRGEKSDKKQEVVAKTDVSRESGYLYFITSDGDVAKAPMARGRKKKAESAS